MRKNIVAGNWKMNKFLKTIVIAPMTSNLRIYPTRVLVKHNDISGTIAIDQIKTIDKSRIVKILGELSEKEIKKTKEIIKETYVD